MAPKWHFEINWPLASNCCGLLRKAELYFKNSNLNLIFFSAMTYIQCHFCKSMVDADIFLLQMCATHLAPDFFLDMVLDRFKIKDWLSLSTDTQHLPTRAYRDQDQKVQIIESCLFFIVSILSTRYGSFCERFFYKFLENCRFISMFIFACWFYNWKRSKLF